MDGVIPMEDNCPIHKSVLSKLVKEDADIKVMDWPPQSPDLNPIENCWAKLKSMLGNNAALKVAKGPAKASAVIVKEATKAWKRISPQYILSLIKSMPTRIQKVIKAKGGPIKY